MAEDSAEYDAMGATEVLGSRQVEEVADSLTANLPTQLIDGPQTAAMFLEPDDVTVALVRQCPECGLMYSAEYDICAVDGSMLEQLTRDSVPATLQHSMIIEEPDTEKFVQPKPAQFEVDHDAIRQIRNEQLGAADDQTIRGSVLDGRYFVEDIIGEGGMGRVYRASQLSVGRTVAVKVLHKQFSDEASIRERFNREARLVSGFNHANTVRLIDFGEAEGHLYMVMEFVEGVSLQKLVGRGPLNVAFALEVIRQVCGPLAEAHRADVIHRDLKPDNLFLTRGVDGRLQVKLLDFGVAHIDPANAKDEATTHRELTKQGVVVGTPEYMAPEQARAEPVHAQTDIFALGVILYQMVSGRLPFEGQTSMHTLFQLVTKPVPPLSKHIPNCPLPLVELAEELLRKDPRDRLDNVIQLARRIREVQMQLSLPPFEELPPGDLLTGLKSIVHNQTADTFVDDSLKDTDRAFAVPDPEPKPSPFRPAAQSTPVLTRPADGPSKTAFPSRPETDSGPSRGLVKTASGPLPPIQGPEDLSKATALRSPISEPLSAPVSESEATLSAPSQVEEPPQPAHVRTQLNHEPTADIPMRQIADASQLPPTADVPKRARAPLNEPTVDIAQRGPTPPTEERRPYIPENVDTVSGNKNLKLLVAAGVLVLIFLMLATALAVYVMSEPT